MKEKIDVTKFLDGTEFGRLKVRIFVYLNENHSENICDLEEIKQEVKNVFSSPEVENIVEQWYKMRFE